MTTLSSFDKPTLLDSRPDRLAIFSTWMSSTPMRASVGQKSLLVLSTGGGSRLGIKTCGGRKLWLYMSTY